MSFFLGKEVNHSESLPALHMAYRHSLPKDIEVFGKSVYEQVQSDKQQLEKIVAKILDGSWRGKTGFSITDVINLGVGGSDFVLRNICSSLAFYKHPKAPNVHFVASIDSSELKLLLNKLNANRTLLIVASKTFCTDDTMTNALIALNWLADFGITKAHYKHHIIGISANAQAMDEFGITKQNQLSMPKWVGGRFSVWSNMGLAVALFLGPEGFSTLKLGAKALDEVFLSNALEQNFVFWHALLQFYHSTKIRVHNLLFYESSFEFMVEHFQQLLCESLGKTVNTKNQKISHPTGPIVLGGSGPKLQHAIFQMLHQGNVAHSSDMILTAKNTFHTPQAHHKSVKNALAQAHLFAYGHQDELVFKSYRGNKPVSVLLLPKADPFYLGFLIAFYEQSVYAQSILFDINPFDQWGVERGKAIAKQFSQPDQIAAEILKQLS